MAKWQDMLKQIEREIDHEDFLRQRTISKTVHPRQNGATANSLQKRYLTYLGDKVEKYRYEDPKIGTPHIQDQKMSQTTVQSIYHLTNIDKIVNPLTLTRIVDIGGGYGNLLAVLRHAGYGGRYTIVDFLQMHKMQRKFLSETVGLTGVEFKTLDQMDDLWGDLLIATFSLNEMPLEDREYIENNITNFKYFYIQHNSRFDGIDNMTYFNNFAENLEDTFDIERWDCPVYRNHPILLGRRK